MQSDATPSRRGIVTQFDEPTILLRDGKLSFVTVYRVDPINFRDAVERNQLDRLTDPQAAINAQDFITSGCRTRF
jgi:hypothetical protein